MDEIKTGINRIKKKVQEVEQHHGRALTAIGGEGGGINNDHDIIDVL